MDCRGCGCSPMYYYTGKLQASSDGTAGTGRYFSNYPVEIADYKEGAKYPYLLRDKYSNQLGWCDRSNLSLSKFH